MVSTGTSLSEFGKRFRDIRQEVDGLSSGRTKVKILAVTKAHPVEVVKMALSEGLGELGENYAQELVVKAAEVGLGSVRWHFIGGLQRNKIKLLAPHVAVWQTVDRPALVSELAKRAAKAKILLQVNTTGEPQKSGCDPSEVAALIGQASKSGLQVLGLMTVGPTSGHPGEAFAFLKSLADYHGLQEVSMGMSGDYRIAVAEGATIIRLGSALLGPRPSS